MKRAHQLQYLNGPQPCRVEVDAHGLPARVDGIVVEQVQDHWRVDEGWWRAVPESRMYYQVLLAGGRLATIYLDREALAWYRQPYG